MFLLLNHCGIPILSKKIFLSLIKIYINHENN
jgi:hypothetical protein